MFKKFFIFSLFSSLLVDSKPANLDRRLNNGLALTPLMGWNSYNHYSCSPNEAIIHSNAQALVDLGLDKKGYKYVTVDCGWSLPNRLSNGTLTPNPARFPAGYIALGKFIHGLGLKFGVYADGGVQMCMTGSPAQAGSLSHETIDAQTFASWGADLLKYDNCYSDAALNYPDTSYTPSVSPKGAMTVMSKAIQALSRPMILQICEWGLDYPALWAPAIGHTWRMSNDIIPYFRTIPRILNQAVPSTDFAGPGQWPDLDMLEVGNKVFTETEEQTHFSLWAILKSPLVIGGALKDTSTSISKSSVAILGNEDVISYNQDSLGKSASFKRRWTKEGYEVWAGPLSGSRTVVAVVNLFNTARSLTLDLPDVGIQKAATVKDIWNGATKQGVLTSYTAKVGAHGTILLELGGTTPAGTYAASDATLSSDKSILTFTGVYAKTTSSMYTALITFATSTSTSQTIKLNDKTYTLPASSTTLSITLPLVAGNANSIAITSSSTISFLTISAPSSTFYPSTSFALSGGATKTNCNGECAPVGTKIGNIAPTNSASLSISAPASATSDTVSKYVNVYFINNDIALSTSWDYGTNTRNMTVSVNGKVTRIEVPLSGKKSELYSPLKGWGDTGIFGVLVDGFKNGSNSVVVGNQGGGSGLVSYGADFVGLEVFW